MKKWISLLLAAVMLLTLAGCGGDSSAKVPTGSSGGILFRGEDTAEVDTPATSVTARQIYDSIEYIPEMFYGSYTIGVDTNSLSDAQEKTYIKQVGFSQHSPQSIGAEHGESVTAIPYAMTAGPENLSHVLCKIEGRNVARLYFLTDQQYMATIYADYVLSGNQITFTPFLNWDYNDETKSLTYEMSDVQLTYDFSFQGPSLALSADGKSVTMSSMHYDSDISFLGHVSDGYLKPGTTGIDTLDSISMFSAYWSMYVTQDGNRINNTAAELQEDGLITLTWQDLEEAVHTRRMVYFQCGFDGYVFADLDGIYCYTATWTEYRNSQLTDNISAEQVDSLNNMTDAQVEALVQKKADLVADLAAAYADSGLAVTVNAQTGEIALDSSVLFAVNKSVVSREGREFLKKFIGIYTSVVFNEKYDGFISQILVEGHTDTTGGYDMNLELSRQRADSVKNYCLSAECGISGDTLAALENTICAMGYSYDRPIYDETGEVDMDASRRVSFRLLIQLSGN